MSTNNALTLMEIHLEYQALVGSGVTAWLGEVEGSNLKSPYLFGRALLFQIFPTLELK